MKAKGGLAMAGLVLCGALVLMAIWSNHRAAPSTTPETRAPARDRSATPGQTANPVWRSASFPKDLPAPEPSPPEPALPATAQESVSSRNRPGTAPRTGKEPIKDPLAREALAFVGCNEEAEVYWVAAINDPSLSAQERQDLIEDLNEDGISDPKHPTPADLPIILNRLDLIEALAPQAMDQVNADAFMEAYKDLVNLAHLTAGGGEPVK